MDPLRNHAELTTRRYFLGAARTGIGTVALASLLNDRLLVRARRPQPIGAGCLVGRTSRPRPSG